MKKSDLKTGMMVENTMGELALVFTNTVQGRDELLFESSGKCDPFSYYDENLKHNRDSDYDFVKVMKPSRPHFSCLSKDLLWELPEEVKEYTIEELIEKVGHEFKIKK